jgi:hypothetical protein
MVSDIFSSWLVKLDKELQYEHRRVVMVVDNCPAPKHTKSCQVSVFATEHDIKTLNDQSIVKVMFLDATAPRLFQGRANHVGKQHITQLRIYCCRGFWNRYCGWKVLRFLRISIFEIPVSS